MGRGHHGPQDPGSQGQTGQSQNERSGIKDVGIGPVLAQSCTVLLSLTVLRILCANGLVDVHVYELGILILITAPLTDWGHVVLGILSPGI